jgi:hypothetical protein
MSLIFSLAALAACFLVIFWLSPIGVPALKRLGNGKPPSDLSFGYEASDTYQLLAAYGQTGVAHWRRLLIIDMVFPAVYGSLLALLASRWASWVGAGLVWRSVAVASPIVASACDYAENLLLLRVIASLPARLSAAVTVASFFTRLKFISFIATLTIPLACWGLTALRNVH